MLKEKVSAVVENLHNAAPNLLVALSGGADSVALLLCLHELGYNVCAAHCNFQLRGEESERDEAFCRNLCKRLGIMLHVCRFDTRQVAHGRNISIEMAARDLRYEWFERLRKEMGCDFIALAHHRDDNIETLLQHIVRGSGIHGLTGMPQRRNHIVRPLLNVSRHEILEYLKEKEQVYVTDSTNADTIYQRNLVRHELLPLLERMNPNIRQTLCDMMQRMRETEWLFDDSVNHWSRKLGITQASDSMVIPLNELRPLFSAQTLLHEWLFPAGFKEKDTEAMLNAKVGALFYSNTHVATVTGDTLVCEKIPVRVDETLLQTDTENTLADNTVVTVTFTDEVRVERGNPKCVTIDIDTLEPPLTCRTVREGDRFQPYGMKGTKLVSDYLTERHINRIEKMKTKVVCDKRGIVWLAGHRIDQRVAVTEKTQQIYVLKLH